MFIVVDSGSTKADWAIVDGPDTIQIVTTKGLNPYFHGPEEVVAELSKKEFTDKVKINEATHVFYYGAGCPDEYFRTKMRDGLRRVFKNAEIIVEHDLLGAARATCGKNPGIAGILGTGSNSCAYDGKNVVDNVPALAHVLGDDGGGVHLGKLILRAWYYRELPQDLEDEFNRAYPEGKDAVMHRIYGEGQNVHIAHFAQFLIHHRQHPFARKLIKEAFREFAVRNLKKYEGWKELEVNLVGSIAEILNEELREVFEEENLTVGKIIRRPIDKLVEYHLSEVRL